MLFIGHLIEKKRQSTTIKCYISAIKAVLLDDEIVINPDTVLLTSLTRACRLQNDRVRTRLPIRQSMLEILVRNIPNLYMNNPQPYLESLYRAMIITAYFGLLRVGEMMQSEHMLKAHNVEIALNKKKLRFILETSKTHRKDKMPQIIKIVGTEMHQQAGKTCPFIAIQDFLSRRKKQKFHDEPFFIFRDRSPVTTYEYRKMLKSFSKLVVLTLKCTIHIARGQEEQWIYT